MKTFYNLVLIIAATLSIPLVGQAQNNIQWEGRWEIISSSSSFCNIHIVKDMKSNQSQPSAILEGLINGEPFRINCTIEEIPERRSIVFHEVPSADGEYKYNKDEPLFLVIVTKTENPLMATPVWMQLDITEKRTNKNCFVRRIPVPNYKGIYKFQQDGVETALNIGRVSKNKFKSSIATADQETKCACELQARHLAVCYPEDGRGAFYLDFNNEGVKVVKSYDQNIYKPGQGANEDSELVWNATLKK